MPHLANKDTCTGCMACLDKCPYKAIYRVEDKSGHNFVKVRKDLCVECNLCEKTCPVINNFRYGENTLKSSFFASWSNINKIREDGATSGIFGTLAYDFISNGGWVAGAIMEGLECKYIITNELDEIPKLQGSKYTSSYPKGIYKEVLKKLKEDKRVLFCGLPCHVAALLCFIPDKYKQKLYTVDLICGGVSSPLLIKRFYKEYKGVKSILKFRDKSDGWNPNGYRYNLTCKTDDGEIVNWKGKRNLVTDGFACELTGRMSCYDCKFSFTQRKSDITIGDLWKDTKFTNQHYNGVSSLIIHSDKGKEIIKDDFMTYIPIDAKNIYLPNPRLFVGGSIKKYFPERRLFGFLINKLSYKSLLRIYGSDLKTMNILWWPFALYRILSFKLAHAIVGRQANNKIKTMKS